jgi:single-stranded DNA-binding protein
MEKTVMVLRVEHMEIEVNDTRTGGKKKIDKANLLVTDGTDRFVCEAFDQVAKDVKADNLTGKLCGLSCQMSVREWQKDGRQGETTQIRVLSCKSLFEEMDKFLDKENKNGNS